VLAVVVTVVLATVQEPLAVITAAVLAFVVADTVNVDWNPVLAGAPLKATVGAICVAIVDWVAEAAR
jgi:hypothetical protein